MIYIFASICIFIGVYWIISSILYYTFGIKKPMLAMLYILDKEERNEVKAEKKLKAEKEERERVKTPEEKIQYENKLNPDYRMMIDDEVKEKYKGLDFSKVIIVDAPHNIWNIDEQKFVNSMEESHEVVTDTNGNMIFQMKTGNRSVVVDSYSLIQINALNTCNKIAIFRHKDPTYRYKVLDNIK